MSLMLINYISQLPSSGFASTWPRGIVILGSTGSIGQNSLAVLEEMPGHFAVLALAGGHNWRLLAEQALRWRPACLAVADDSCAAVLRKALSVAPDYKPQIFTGQSGYAQLASLPEADMVLSAQSGAAGLAATYAAIGAGKVVALANKESLVLAGDIIRKACCESGAAILPVDSEHNAIFQCLCGQSGSGFALQGGPDLQQGAAGAGVAKAAPGCLAEAAPGVTRVPAPQPSSALKRIILTASGGPFLGRSAASLAGVSKAQALAHPTWSMGVKITIDSATLMNKGLEYIEACHLFGLAPEQVEVIVHPQSIIHSLVEYQDNSRLAQLGVPDMRIPISCCLGWPYRLRSGASGLDLTRQDLTFCQPDFEAFPALLYWQEAYREGRGLAVALNAANEVAVDLFMRDKIDFLGITRLARRVMDAWDESAAPASIEDVLGMDAKARAVAAKLAK